MTQNEHPDFANCIPDAIENAAIRLKGDYMKLKTLIIAILLCAGTTLAHGDEPASASDIVKMWAPTYHRLQFMGVTPTKRWLFMFARPEYEGYPAMPLTIVVPPKCTPKEFEAYVITATWAQYMTYDYLHNGH
jgi:hypothetical protein